MSPSKSVVQPFRVLSPNECVQKRPGMYLRGVGKERLGSALGQMLRGLHDLQPRLSRVQLSNQSGEFELVSMGSITQSFRPTEFLMSLIDEGPPEGFAVAHALSSSFSMEVWRPEGGLRLWSRNAAIDGAQFSNGSDSSGARVRWAPSPVYFEGESQLDRDWRRRALVGSCVLTPDLRVEFEGQSVSYPGSVAQWLNETAPQGASKALQTTWKVGSYRVHVAAQLLGKHSEDEVVDLDPPGPSSISKDLQTAKRRLRLKSGVRLATSSWLGPWGFCGSRYCRLPSPEPVQLIQSLLKQFV